MDHMNSDNQLDVPDTPDRLVTMNINGRSYVNLESELYTTRHSGYQNVATEQSGNRLSVSVARRRRLCMRPPRNITGNSLPPRDVVVSVGTGSSLPSSNSVPSNISSIPNSKEKHNLLLTKRDNTEVKDRISSQQDRHVIDLTKRSGSTSVFVKAPPVGAQENGQVENFKMRSEHSHMHGMTSSVPSSSVSKGKETADLLKLGSSFKPNREKDYSIETQLRDRKDSSANSSRVTGQKRLVRNGCISPNNIAKGKKPAVKEDKNVLTNGMSATSLTASGTNSDGAKGLMSKNGFSTLKGKGVLINSSLLEELEGTHPSSRNSISIEEKAKETVGSSRDAFKSFEGTGGWRSTHNRGLNMNLSLSNFSSEPAGPVGAIPGPQLHQINGHRTTVNAVKKRLKSGPASSSNGECSTSAPDDLDVISLVSPESRINTRSTRNPNHGVEPVIIVDSPSATTRPEGSRVGCSSSRNEDARARQLEADERLARELQEQLYNEAPSFGIGEIDEDLALALAQEGIHASSGGENQLPSPNGLSVANMRRRQSRNASNASRRVSQARASTSTRMARLRNRFPGQPRMISSSRGRNSLFPPHMDVDMRMHILETLEAFSNMDVDNNLLQTQRDFNENDYEMLLALDENNHQHGASSRQINGLPQSTVQTENLEEVCAVCLETPTMGDVIRHLPCLHKFHKDCIDPWLTRKTSCPVCKSSIT